MQFIKDIKKNWVLLLMTLPGMVLIICFKYMPMFGTFIAFKNFSYNKGFFGSEWMGLKNFEFLFKTSDAFVITRNTILYNTVFIIFGIILSIALAIAFDLLGSTKLNQTNQIIMLFPYFISWVVASQLVYAFLSGDRGFINNIIELFHGEAIDWYSETRYWPYILVLCNLWKTVGYNSIIYYSSIKGFSIEYYEAAKIDGATWFQQITYITIPLLKSIVVIMFIISIGGIFYSDFGLFYLVPKNSGPLYSVTSTIDTYVYNGLMGVGNIGMSTAAGLYQSIVGFILVIVTNSIVKKVSEENAMF